MIISVVGQGYVGLPLAIAAASVGHTVFGIDSNPKLITNLNSGISPISDVPSSSVQELIDKGNYLATVDFSFVANSEVVVICVPTPLDSNSEPDLSYLDSAVQSVSENLGSQTLVILESTVSPGTTRGRVSKLLEMAN